MQTKTICGKEIKITFDGEFYIGQYKEIQIKRFYKIDVVDWFCKYFNRSQLK